MNITYADSTHDHVISTQENATVPPMVGWQVFLGKNTYRVNDVTLSYHYDGGRCVAEHLYVRVKWVKLGEPK